MDIKIQQGTKKKINLIPIPMILEKTSQGDRSYDIYSRLLEDRIIFINGIINDNLSNIVIAQMLFLEAKNPLLDIFLYINSPGGNVTSGFSIYDTMQFISPKINTICVGQACSMAALLLCSGEPEKRFCLPNSRIMIHQPLGSFQGQVSDILIHAQEINNMKKKINNLLSQHTGQILKKIKKDTERDYFLSPEKAKKYGLIDIILTKRN